MGRVVSGFFVVLAALGVALVWIGANRPDGFSREMLIGLGLTVGPASLVTLVFRLFLVEEVKREFVTPLIDRVRSTLEKENNRVQERILEELDRHDELREGGVIRCYRNREEALSDFLRRIREPDGPIVVVGSSLRGLLPNEDCQFAREVRQYKHRMSFVLTHPEIADFRASQEQRRLQEIGQEVVDCLRLLSRLGVESDHVYLRRGTPTCFGIMTPELMLLNPYPHLSPAMRAPCFLVSRLSNGRTSYIYETYQINHFDVYTTTSTERLKDLEAKARELETALPEYARAAAAYT